MSSCNAKGLYSASTVCCLKNPPWGMQTRDEERTKATILKCKEGMCSSRKLPREENAQNPLEALCPDVFTSSLYLLLPGKLLG